MKRRDSRQLANKRGFTALKPGFTALVAAAMLAAAGCGGSSTAAPSGSAASRTEPTESRTSNDSAARSRLIAKADAICRRLNRELAAAPSRLEARQIASSAPRNAALERRALAELGRLRPPASLARDWRQIIAYRRTLAEELAELGRYAKAGDVPAMKALGASKKRVHQKLSELATRDGFKDCSRVGAERSGAQALPLPLPARRTRAPVKL